MGKEDRRGEPNRDSEPHEIILGVPFKPYRNTRRFCIPGEGEKPFLVSEDYTHVLALRKQLSLYGILGVIDVISENHLWDNFLEQVRSKVEKPFGEVHFESIYRGRDVEEEFVQRPYLLRFSFLARTPSEYAKLLVSYADVKLGKKHYFHTWNQSRPLVKRYMQFLEEKDEPLLVVEKNLINFEDLDETGGDVLTDEEKDEYEKMEIGRTTSVWLSKVLKKLRTIELDFHQFGGGHNRHGPLVPTEPEIDRSPILV